MRNLERDRPYDVESKSFIRRESSQQAYLDTFKPTSPRGVVSSSGRARVTISPARLFQQIFLAVVGCPWPTVVRDPFGQWVKVPVCLDSGATV